MTAALVRLDGVVKRYGDGGPAPVEVLAGIDFSLDAGCAVAITGPSGSGKSTLLNLIGGLDRPTSGRVVFDGRAVGDLDAAELARYRAGELGFVFQAHHLLPQCTVWENVLLPALALSPGGTTAEAEARAERLITRVGLAERRDHTPAGLSSGERQRAALARACVNRPRLLLADEPTGALDRRNGAMVADLLLELNREEGMAAIVVTHSVELAARMPRTYALTDGRLMEAG